MLNKKGFTLVELLAVIVILGVVLGIAVPSVTGYIEKSKKDAFVIEAKNYVDVVVRNIETGEYQAPKENNDVTVINLNYIEMQKENKESPYGAEWVDNKCYVAVINEGSSTSPKYAYYFAAQDAERNAIPLTKISEISNDSITNNARNTMEVTIQSLAGNINGNTTTKGIISGLQNAIEDGNTLDWNVIIYTNQE